MEKQDIQKLVIIGNEFFPLFASQCLHRFIDSTPWAKLVLGQY